MSYWYSKLGSKTVTIEVACRAQNQLHSHFFELLFQFEASKNLVLLYLSLL